MFRKFFIFALFATACGYVFAADTSNNCYNTQRTQQQVWPAPGSEADVQYNSDTEEVAQNNTDAQDGYRIVSKSGTGLVIENNLNVSGQRNGTAWAGGADLTHPYQAPSGFNIFESQAEMPLMHTEMMEDDGGSILAISRSSKSQAKNTPKMAEVTNDEVSAKLEYLDNDSNFEVESEEVSNTTSKEIIAASSSSTPGQVRSWVVASGQTLREILQDWCDKEGWDLVWNTSREYPIQASAVFKGRFMDVSSALVRNFSRATPIPYAKFFKGNRVLVITTTEE